jgi:hypothetical protein
VLRVTAALTANGHVVYGKRSRGNKDVACAGEYDGTHKLFAHWRKAMNLMPFTYGWLVLVVVGIVLGIYRQVLGRHEDETVHLAANEAAMVNQQKNLAKKIESVAHWFKLLVLIASLYGVALLAVYLHRVWIQSSMPH